LKRHNNDGELKELPSHKKTAAAKQFPDKALTYGMLKHIARERGYGDGWASHKFHTIPISTSRIVASPIGYPLGKLLVVAGPPVYDPLAGSRQLSRGIKRRGARGLSRAKSGRDRLSPSRPLLRKVCC
jgi:hypothetical protein